MARAHDSLEDVQHFRIQRVVMGMYRYKEVHVY